MTVQHSYEVTLVDGTGSVGTKSRQGAGYGT